nr:hypothetical protein [Streptomyces hygroscopicus]
MAERIARRIRRDDGWWSAFGKRRGHGKNAKAEPPVHDDLVRRMVASGLALLVGGGIEIRYTRYRSMRTYTQLMIAYDSGWMLTALTGFLMARQGYSAGGEVWMGYQTAAPIIFAALLVAAAPTQMASGTRRDLDRTPCR